MYKKKIKVFYFNILYGKNLACSRRQPTSPILVVTRLFYILIFVFFFYLDFDRCRCCMCGKHPNSIIDVCVRADFRSVK